ncbi:MAG: sulfur carrier protein ThiS [Desulfobacterales bacterium]|nr:sulfur carrier protein ThiS [Desulfobacterales bacterium]MCU0584565.1 sulfur carrier protein ThiS [Desulfobacterales bacterium]
MIRVGGREHPWRPGLTVAALLAELSDTECPVVRINQSYVSRPRFESTLIPDGAEVFLIPMIAGG